MPAWFINLLAAVAAFAAMEGVAWFTHRYIMHGPLWALHRSHHEPRRGAFELNDLFAFWFAGIAVALFWAGAAFEVPALWWAAVGATVYGAVYAFVHDGLVHQRWGTRFIPRGGYAKRLVQAHKLHHAVHERHGAVSFGFLWAADVRRLKAQLASRRAAVE